MQSIVIVHAMQHGCRAKPPSEKPKLRNNTSKTCGIQEMGN